jgi:hypothetical protein
LNRTLRRFVEIYQEAIKLKQEKVDWFYTRGLAFQKVKDELSGFVRFFVIM